MAVCPVGHASAAADFCDICGLLIGQSAAAPAVPAPDAPGEPGEGGSAGGGMPPGRTCPNCGAPRFGQFCEACGLDFATGTLPAGSGPFFPPSGSAPFSRAGAVPAAGVPPVLAPAPPASAVPPTSADAPVPPAPDLSPPWEAMAAEAPSAARGGPDDWSAMVFADRAYYDRIQDASGPDAAAIGFPAYCAERRFRLVGQEMRIGRHSASRGLNPEIDLTGPPSDPGISRLHAVLLGRPDGGWAVLDPGSANGTLVNGVAIPVGEQVALRDGDRINMGAWTAITIQRD